VLVNLREFFSENFAGDLEYHPQRGVLYLCLGAAALSFWFFASAEDQFTTIPLVCALGSLTLICKGIFLLRRTSEGLGLSQKELADLSDPSKRKRLPSITAQTSRVFQDFGTGPLLLWPLLNFASDINRSWNDPPRFRVFLTGAILFFLGWLIRYITSSSLPER